MAESIEYPPNNIWVTLEKQSEYEATYLSPIKSSVEKLKEVFINRDFYSCDTEWLGDIASYVHELCEETNMEEHWMYPKEEFVENYGTIRAVETNL
tara:strand:+ start:185 stop:472 length:288 start_codon:yes stop_codon:yes gene_type:complete